MTIIKEDGQRIVWNKVDGCMQNNLEANTFLCLLINYFSLNSQMSFIASANVKRNRK